jgi:hypothetical protein
MCFLNDSNTGKTKEKEQLLICGGGLLVRMPAPTDRRVERATANHPRALDDHGLVDEEEAARVGVDTMRRRKANHPS